MSVTIKINNLLGGVLRKALIDKKVLRESVKLLNTRNISATSKLYDNVPFTLTDIGEGIREVAVKEWFVKVGDKVSQFDNICEVQSDKASVTITSRYDGVITKLYYEIDEIAHVGKPLVDIETDETVDTPTNLLQESQDDKKGALNVLNKVDPLSTEESSTKLAIPSVRRLAQEHKINLEHVHGSGKGGRILKEDILEFIEMSKNKIKGTSETPTKDVIEPIKGFTRAMIKSMTESLKIPHLLYCDEIAITELSKIRKALNEKNKESGIKLTMLPFIIKAISNGLLKYPVLNASLDGTQENIIYKGSHNIGIAMDTNAGLVVPVIKNVEDRSIFEIAKELDRLLKHRKDGRFTTTDLSGGTFTVSNVGNIGGTYAGPIISPLQSAIIAIGRSKIVPKFDVSGNVVAEEIFNLSASADHRIIDGATVANFVNLVKDQIENPYSLLLHS
ncbi:hypothetical protein FQA39_LY09282 [Lamprigera yunnana]|nr:hypothetical protein FQA39_LY09282 [Lamprigera yunnana]